jgi:LemA protein
VETFPSNLIANNFGFKREIMFDLGTEGRARMDEPPTIKF